MGLLTKMEAGLGESNKDGSALYLFLFLGLMGKGMVQFPEYRWKGCIDMTGTLSFSRGHTQYALTQ